jgi:hypothetical protein
MAKPPVRKPSSRQPTDWGALLGPLKDPKALISIGVIMLVVVIYFGPSLMPASTAADRKKLEQLQQILADLHKLRETKAGPSEWSEFAKKAEAIAKPITEELKKTANRNYPARQNLLWASRDRLPEMLKGSSEKPSTAEEKFEAHLYDAATILGVAKGDPPKGSNAARPPGAAAQGNANGDP